MKKTFEYILTAIAALPVLVSCVKDYSGTEPYDPDAPATKFASFRIIGAMGDKVAYFDSKGNVRELISDNISGEGCFSGKVTENPEYYFLQPFKDTYSMEDKTVEVSIPGEQEAVEGGIDEEAYLLAGKTDRFACTMERFSRIVSFGLNVDSEMYGITLRAKSGAVLAGKRSVSFADEKPVASDFTSEKKVSLFMGNPSNGNLGFVLPFGNLSKGLTLELVRLSDDRTAVLDFTEDITDSETEDIHLGTINSSDLSWQKIIPMRFVESTLIDKVEWPFIEPATAAGSAEFTTTRGGYKIKVDNFKGAVAEGLKGFVFGSAAGDCISLPAVEGLALNGVTIVLGADGANGNPCIKNASGKVVGEVWSGSKKAGDSKTWNFFGEHNVVNKLYLNSDPGAGGCALRSIILSYRAAADKEYIVEGVTTAPATDVNPKTGSAVLHASYSASLDEPAKYDAGFEYRIKGTGDWTKVTVENPAQSDFTYSLSGIETEHIYEFRAFVKGETDIDTTYGQILEFEISNTLTLNLVFGDGNTSTKIYDQWHSLWGLELGNSGVTGPVDKIYTQDGVDYKFTLYADHNVAYRKASSKYWGYCFDYTTSSTEPRCNGWMLLPGVEGMRLDYIEMELNTKGLINVSSSVDSNNFGDKAYTGGSNINQTATTATHKLEITSSSAGERVYICSESRNVTIMYLILKYKPAK